VSAATSESSAECSPIRFYPSTESTSSSSFVTTTCPFFERRCLTICQDRAPHRTETSANTRLHPRHRVLASPTCLYAFLPVAKLSDLTASSSLRRWLDELPSSLPQLLLSNLISLAYASRHATMSSLLLFNSCLVFLVYH
jgi:hypothetical protein